jgi:hypothetical protein
VSTHQCFFVLGAFLFVARVAILHWNLEDV